MPNFVVTIQATGRAEIIVEAKDWEEAESKALEQISYNDFDGANFEVVDCEQDE